MFVMALHACDDPFKDSAFTVYEERPISTYLETRSDEFSEWIAILKYADLYNALNQASRVYTMFAPTNEAVEAFYVQKDVTGIEELGQDYARQLVKYHVAVDSVSLNDIIAGGVLTNKTLSDDFLEVVVGEEGGINALYMNGDAHIKETAISVSNGLVYVLNNMMRPMIESVYQQMSDNGLNDILIEAMDLTGWRDTLNIISESGVDPLTGLEVEIRRYYTVLAVPDSIFEEKGITSVEELIDYLGADADYTDKTNELFKYVGFHILRGNYRIADLTTFERETEVSLKETSTPNALLKISREADSMYYLNYEAGVDRARFIEDESDYIVKNGYIHQLDDILPIYDDLTPIPVYFDFCNYPELGAYIASNGVEGQIFQTRGPQEYSTDISYANLPCFDYQMGPLGNPNSGGALTYWTVKDQETNQLYGTLYGDGLELQLGFLGHVTMNTPTIMPGKYKATLFYVYVNSLDPLSRGEGSNGGQTIFELEDATGARRANVVLFSQVTLDGRMGIYSQPLFNELHFDDAGSYPVKITVNDPAASTFASYRLRLDYILFEPID